MNDPLASIPSLFDISYFPEKHHARCADVSNYINDLIDYYLAHPGPITTKEIDSMLVSLQPVFEDPALFMYQFLLMLNSVVSYTLFLSAVMKEAKKTTTSESNQNAYL